MSRGPLCDSINRKEDSAFYVYVFIRTDLPVAHQIVQSNHAVYHLAGLRSEHGTPNIVLIGMPNVRALERVERKLQANQIPHYAWMEPDHDFGFTAIATAPLRGEQRELMKNYRVYAPVAQLRECPALNGEAVGENPTGCASFDAAGAEASARV